MATKKAATAEEVLGRPIDAAEKDPARVLSGKKIEARWKKYYERLLQIRDGIIDQEQRLQKQTAANQPQFITDPGAETANAAFEQDKALGRVSTYQDMLNEVNAALARIEDGSYGVCELTGKRIPAERLEAIPWTRFTAEAEAQLEREGKAPVHFEIPPQFSVREVTQGRTEVESELHREQTGAGGSRTRPRKRNARMPAKSKKQQMAAGAALSAKRGKRSKKSLKGASRSMVESMSESELERMASAKRKKLPTRANRGSSSKRSSKKSGGKKSGSSKGKKKSKSRR